MKNDCGRIITLNRSDFLECEFQEEDDVIRQDPFDFVLTELGINSTIIGNIDTIKLNVAGFETDLE